MLNLKYLFRLLAAFFSRFKSIILLSVFAGVFIFPLITLLKPYLWGKTIERIGIAGKYRLDNLPYFILDSVSDGLTKLNEDGSVKPGIASSWESNDKGKTWIFHISKDEYWQDGKKITSQNIQINFSDVVIEKPDASTIVFKLQNPFTPFPVVLSKPFFKKGFMGNGDWKISKITVSGNNVERVILSNKEKNRKIYKFYPTEERAKLAFKLGEVDKLIDIYNPKPFDSWPNLKVTKNIDTGKYVALFFNSDKGKLTSDKSFRQALAYAIDKDRFGGQRAISPISPASWAYNPQVKPYNFDQTKAKTIINDLPKETKSNLSIKLITSPILLSEAEIISKDWENTGVKTTVQVTSVIPNEFEALLTIFDIPKDPDQYSIWHSTQEITNISNYKSPRIDKLLEDGRTEIYPETRRKIYLDFQRFLVEDSPAIFLYHPVSFMIERR